MENYSILEMTAILSRSVSTLSQICVNVLTRNERNRKIFLKWCLSAHEHLLIAVLSLCPVSFIRDVELKIANRLGEKCLLVILDLLNQTVWKKLFQRHNMGNSIDSDYRLQYCLREFYHFYKRADHASIARNAQFYRSVQTIRLSFDLNIKLVQTFVSIPSITTLIILYDGKQSNWKCTLQLIRFLPHLHQLNIQSEMNDEIIINQVHAALRKRRHLMNERFRVDFFYRPYESDEQEDEEIDCGAFRALKQLVCDDYVTIDKLNYWQDGAVFGKYGDCWESLLSALAGKKSLTGISVSNMSIKDEDISPLFFHERKGTRHQKLQTRTLKQLDISMNQLTAITAQWIHESMKKGFQVTSLNFSCNSLGDSGALVLAGIVRDQTIGGVIETLRVDSNGISSEGLRALLSAVQETNSLKSLDISWNTRVDISLGNFLCGFIEANTSLRKLYLCGMEVDSEYLENFFRDLSHALELNDALEDLHLQWTEVTDEGIALLSKMFTGRRKRFGTVNLSYTKIQTCGLHLLIDSLRTREVLHLSDPSFEVPAIRKLELKTDWGLERNSAEVVDLERMVPQVVAY